jgi:hypothetical protein
VSGIPGHISALWFDAIDRARPAPRADYDRRRAVSGLYYAAFHLVSWQQSFDPHRQHRHKALIEHLRHTRAPRLVKAGGRLESLMNARIKADYSPVLPVSPGDVMSAVHHAEAVRQLLGVALVAPEPQDIYLEPPRGRGADVSPKESGG